MNDNSVIKYKGEYVKLANVPASYLMDLYNSDKRIDPNLYQYILDNLDVLHKQIKESQQS